MAIDSTSQQVYDEATVIDALNVSNWKSPAVYQSLKQGGVTAINATITVWEGYQETMDNIAAWLRRFQEYSDSIVQAKTVDDILAAKREGKTGVILGWQNASPIGNDLDRLALFHALGVRIVQITYNERNLLGNGCYERTDEGLSSFGVDAVKEINRLGILVDLSHVGDRTTLDAIEVSDGPVSFTHANARSHFNHPRNKSDDALRLLAEKGGVVGANAFPSFMPKGYDSTLEDYVDSIEDLVHRVGIDHVGIGTDFTQDQSQEFFDWIFAQQGTKYRPIAAEFPASLGHPKDLETPDKFPNVAKVLLARGYKAEDAAKILGGNWLRLFKEVWR